MQPMLAANTTYYWGNVFNPDYVFYRDNTTNAAEKVSSCPNDKLAKNYCANNFGLMHMSGNVWEIMSDNYYLFGEYSYVNGHSPVYAGTMSFIVKGGSFNNYAPAENYTPHTHAERNTFQAKDNPFSNSRESTVGFRVVRIAK